ncbi:thiolase-like protein [Aspergillus multicolor]|uniref:putative PKS-like enzyme n=1 Tax=Aspergillus multicolor TaxID=41759 RepID=UPI003CCD16E3
MGAQHSTQNAIAIVGLTVRLPGGMHSPAEFRDMLINKRDGRCEVPETRYNINGFQQPTKPHHSILTRHGYSCVRIPQCLMAERMHPQQRLLMEIVWECFESAGKTDWHRGNIGCFVGSFGEDWLDLAAKDTENSDRYRAVGTGGFALANRVSYEYDLRGPSIAIQTGCSASLVCLHEACLALHAGTCSSAIVTGTNLILGPSMTTAMADNGVLSPEGICRTFVEKTNGFSHREAEPNLGWIRATGTNFDGRTPNLTSLCPESQEAFLRSTYARPGISDINETALFECHGTATLMGDKVEASVMAKLGACHKILIGAVKPNVGHSEGASGLTSLIKAVLALENETILPNIHFNTPNPEISWTDLRVPTKALPWPSERAARVSVNSFGIGGSNVHVIVEAPRAHTTRLVRETAPIQQLRVLLVSAQSDSSLQQRISDVVDYANSKSSSARDLDNLAYTLAVKRRHLLRRAFPLKSLSHENC